MVRKKDKKNQPDDLVDIHQYYMNIINATPNIVYWVDVECNLKGCNNNFVNLLNLKKPRDFTGTPYAQMSKSSGWTPERINALKLDDMKVIFSQEPLYEVEEAPFEHKSGEVIYYQSNRVPLFDQNKQVIGLIVVLTDISALKKLELERMVSIPAAPPLAEVREQLIPPKILMVEDNFVAQKVGEALLTALNCQVDIAESGDQATKLFNPGKYDLIFMDIGLEDTSGYMVAKKLRKMEENTTHHVPIIALTSYQADVVKNDCFDYAMDGVLTKPLSSEQAEQIMKYFIYHENVIVNGLRCRTK